MKRKSYKKYKDSGIEWLGKIPEHWEVKRLRFLLSHNEGGIWGEDFDDDGIVILRSTEQTIDGKWNINNPAKRKISPVEYNLYRLMEGDLVITKSSGSSLHIGKTSVVTKEIENLNCCYSNFMQRIRVKKSLLPFYLWYILNNEIGRKQFNYFSTTTTGLSNLNSEIISMINIAFPSFREQKTIANFLDRETEQIDSLIQKKGKQIELLKEKRSVFITQTVTKGLNSNVKMKDSGVEWLGKIPEHWEFAKLKYVTKFIYGDSLLTQDRTLGNIPVYGSNGIIGSHNLSNTKGPCIIIGRKGSFGKITYSDQLSFVIDTAFYIDLTCTTSDLKWLYYCLQQLKLDSFSKDSAVPGLAREDAYEKILPSFHLKEQKAIANFLDKETAQIDSLIEKITKSIKLLKEYRSALITSAVTGQIDVRESQLKTAKIIPFQKLKKEHIKKSIKTIKPAIVAKATLKKRDSQFIKGKKPRLVAQKVSNKSASLIFKKTALGAEIVAQMQKDPHFGRTKFMKTLYLCEAHLQIPLKGDYKREVAGPLDNSIYQMESIMKKNKWFQVVKTGSMFKYQPLKNSTSYKSYFYKYWGDYKIELNKLLSLVKKFTTEQSEIVDTIYAVWNDFLLEGKKPSDSEIIYEVKNNWQESKKRFSDNQLQKAIHWMRKQKLIPKGYGSKTKNLKDKK